jgi:hypothetical protein
MKVGHFKNQNKYLKTEKNKKIVFPTIFWYKEFNNQHKLKIKADLIYFWVNLMKND